MTTPPLAGPPSTGGESNRKVYNTWLAALGLIVSRDTIKALVLNSGYLQLYGRKAGMIAPIEAILLGTLLWRIAFRQTLK